MYVCLLLCCTQGQVAPVEHVQDRLVLAGLYHTQLVGQGEAMCCSVARQLVSFTGQRGQYSVCWAQGDLQSGQLCGGVDVLGPEGCPACAQSLLERCSRYWQGCMQEVSDSTGRVLTLHLAGGSLNSIHWAGQSGRLSMGTLVKHDPRPRA